MAPGRRAWLFRQLNGGLELHHYADRAQGIDQSDGGRQTLLIDSTNDLIEKGLFKQAVQPDAIAAARVASSSFPVMQMIGKVIDAAATFYVGLRSSWIVSRGSAVCARGWTGSTYKTR